MSYIDSAALPINLFHHHVDYGYNFSTLAASTFFSSYWAAKRPSAVHGLSEQNTTERRIFKNSRSWTTRFSIGSLDSISTTAPVTCARQKTQDQPRSLA
jgi:hypothetical protein